MWQRSAFHRIIWLEGTCGGLQVQLRHLELNCQHRSAVTLHSEVLNSSRLSSVHSWCHSLLYHVPNFQRFSVHSHEPLQGWCYCGNNVSPCAVDLCGVTANLQSHPDILPGPANKNLCTFPVVHSCETQKEANLHVVSTALNTISSALRIFISPSNANNSRLVSQGQIKQAFCTRG